MNNELQAKVDEPSRAGKDMGNLLNSTNIGTFLLADQLHVRRFTATTAKILQLLRGDAGPADDRHHQRPWRSRPTSPVRDWALRRAHRVS